MSMNYALRQIGDVTVLELSGRIVLCDTAVIGQGASQVLHDLVRELAKHGRKKILLNLRDIEYVDSSGLGELVAALSSVLNSDGHLRFCGANERVYELLCVTRLDGVLHFSSDEAAAIEAFSDDPDEEASVA